MTKLEWGKSGERFYEAGVDRGVLYPHIGPGVSWNGLISITEAEEVSTQELIYVDGRPLDRGQIVESFAATLESFTYPDEFEQYDGITDGATAQDRKSFGLCYRTGIGTDLNPEHGYKIHLVYNALATPSEKSYATITDEIDPTTFSWEISTKPLKIRGSAPSAHLVIDTRKAYPWAIEAFEAVLYGSDLEQARLPSPEEVLAIFEDASIVQITDHGDGSWTAEGPDDAVMLIDETTFEISWASAVHIDTNSYLISSL